jgi:hypothetical protein
MNTHLSHKFAARLVLALLILFMFDPAFAGGNKPPKDDKDHKVVVILNPKNNPHPGSVDCHSNNAGDLSCKKKKAPKVISPPVTIVNYSQPKYERDLFSSLGELVDPHIYLPLVIK